MKKLSVLVLLLLVTVVVGTVLAAPPTNFVAHLVGDNEVPPNGTQAQGQVKFQLREDGLHFMLITANIEDVTQAHIHCGAADVNGPVVVFLYGFNAAGVDNNGVLNEGVITAANIIPRPDSAACPGGLATFDELIAKMRSGDAYVNAHTIVLPGGEIRGQVQLAGN